MVSEEMRLWSHDNVAHMLLEVVAQRTELGMILRESRGEEREERSPRVHVNLALSSLREGRNRGDIDTV